MFLQILCLIWTETHDSEWVKEEAFWFPRFALMLDALDSALFINGSLFQVHVHELGCEGCSKSYVFRGTKDLNAKQIQVRELLLHVELCSL